MAEPTAFISHFRVKEGAIEQLTALSGRASAELEAGKPRTVLFLAYLDEGRGVISFLHAFPDAEAMDVHFEGSGERSRAVAEYIEPLGWEIYGPASPSALETLREAAAASGATLSVHPEYVGGFLRLAQSS